MTECRLTDRGLQHDRQFMIVTDNGACVSQKRAPQMCAVRPSISESQRHLVLSHPGSYVLHTVAQHPQLHWGQGK